MGFAMKHWGLEVILDTVGGDWFSSLSLPLGSRYHNLDGESFQPAMKLAQSGIIPLLGRTSLTKQLLGGVTVQVAELYPYQCDIS